MNIRDKIKRWEKEKIRIRREERTVWRGERYSGGQDREGDRRSKMSGKRKAKEEKEQGKKGRRKRIKEKRKQGQIGKEGEEKEDG